MTSSLRRRADVGARRADVHEQRAAGRRRRRRPQLERFALGAIVALATADLAGVDVASYALVSVAAVVRVVLPIAAPTMTMGAIVCSAAPWSAAFAIFSVHYWPVLTRPRLDGAPG